MNQPLCFVVLMTLCKMSPYMIITSPLLLLLLYTTRSDLCASISYGHGILFLGLILRKLWVFHIEVSVLGVLMTAGAYIRFCHLVSGLFGMGGNGLPYHWRRKGRELQRYSAGSHGWYEFVSRTTASQSAGDDFPILRHGYGCTGQELVVNIIFFTLNPLFITIAARK